MTASVVEALADPSAGTHSRLRTWWKLGNTAFSFGIVGLGGLVLDVAVFTALRAGAFAERPLTAGVISAGAAIIFNWVGNRVWTFRDVRRTSMAKEAVEYAAVALLGLGVSLLCLAVSHYVLGLHSLGADNVAKNVIGLALGTAVRFTLSRWWIWRPERVVHGQVHPAQVSATHR